MGKDDDRTERPHTCNIAGYLGLIIPFTGESEGPTATQYIDCVDEIGGIAGWTDEEKVLVAKQKIRSPATEFLLNHSEIKAVKTFAKFKTEFLKYFKRQLPLAVRLQQLTGCKQGNKEKVKSFANRISNLASELLKVDDTDNAPSPQVRQISDNTKLAQFVNGLNSKLQRLVLSHQPGNFQEALEYAVMEEENESLFSAATTNTSINTASAVENSFQNSMLSELVDAQKQLQATVNALSSQVEQVKRNIPTTRGPEINQQYNSGPNRETGNDVICYKCGAPGHIARFCQAPPNGQRYAPRPFFAPPYNTHQNTRFYTPRQGPPRRPEIRERFPYRGPNQGFNQGMNQGNQGLNQGMSQGFNQGLNQGFNQGLNQGWNFSDGRGPHQNRYSGPRNFGSEN